MGNSITSAYLDPSNSISAGYSPESTDAGGGDSGAVANILKDIEQLLGDGRASISGGNSAGGASAPAATGAQGDLWTQGGQDSNGGRGGAGSFGDIQKVLQDLQKLEQGNSENSASGTGSGSAAAGAGGAGSGQGRGLHDVKLNTAAGGEALHLQADSNGTLYNGSGDSVGQIGKDGSVSLNSGATKEIERLMTGGRSLSPGDVSPVHGEKGDGGNISFSSSQVTVSAGDLAQKNDF